LQRLFLLGLRLCQPEERLADGEVADDFGDGGVGV
jgi:hypothetical protein